jgi:hypothetical protein
LVLLAAWALLGEIDEGAGLVQRALSLLAMIVLGFLSWSARAQVLDLVFVLLAFRAWYAWKNRARRGWLLGLPVMALLWANLHGPGVLLLDAVAGAIGVELLIEWRLHRPRPPLLLPLACLAAGNVAFLANPLGAGLFTYPFATVTSAAQHAVVVEWQAPPWTTQPLPGIVLVAALLLIAFLALTPRRMPPVAIAATAIVTSILTLQAARYFLFSGPFVALTLAPSPLAALARRARGGSAPEKSARRARRQDRPAKPLVATPRSAPTRAQWIGAAAAAIALAVYLPGATRVLRPGWLDSVFPANPFFPVEAGQFLRDRGCRGRVFNDYGWGGYLAWTWGQPVGVYSAADALGEEKLREYTTVQSLSSDPAEYLRKYTITLMVVPSEADIGRWAFDHGWRVLHGDPVAVVLAAPGSSPCQSAAGG